MEAEGASEDVLCIIQQSTQKASNILKRSRDGSARVEKSLRKPRRLLPPGRARVPEIMTRTVPLRVHLEIGQRNWEVSVLE
jgi:hypothetical protein